MCKAIKSCANNDRTVRGIYWKRSTLSLQSSVLSPIHMVPTSLRVAKTGKNHLKEEITPLLTLGQTSNIAEQYQIQDMQRSCTYVSSPIKESSEPTQRDLQLVLYSEVHPLPWFHLFLFVFLLSEYQMYTVFIEPAILADMMKLMKRHSKTMWASSNTTYFLSTDTTQNILSRTTSLEHCSHL